MKRKRNTYSAKFKTQVVVKLLSGQYTLNELADKHQICLIYACQQGERYVDEECVYLAANKPKV